MCLNFFSFHCSLVSKGKFLSLDLTARAMLAYTETQLGTMQLWEINTYCEMDQSCAFSFFISTTVPWNSQSHILSSINWKILNNSTALKLQNFIQWRSHSPWCNIAQSFLREMWCKEVENWATDSGSIATTWFWNQASIQFLGPGDNISFKFPGSLLKSKFMCYLTNLYMASGWNHPKETTGNSMEFMQWLFICLHRKTLTHAENGKFLFLGFKRWHPCFKNHFYHLNEGSCLTKTMQLRNNTLRVSMCKDVRTLRFVEWV